MSQVNSQPNDPIEHIELHLVSMPFESGRKSTAHPNRESIDTYNASSRTFTQMESLLVKVTTRSGLEGWGEGFGHKSNPATWSALEQIVGPYFLGRTTMPADVMPAAHHAFHAFGRTGPVLYALSAIDIALWDITAQRAGLPLRQLVEPRSRNKISAYASLVHYGEDPAEVSHHVRRAVDVGFTGVKLHESSTEAIAAAHQALDGQPLMVDVNCRWDLPSAQDALAALADLDLLWLEEPIFPPDDTATLRILNDQFKTIAAGENHSGYLGLLAAMEQHAVAYAQPSVGKIGGFSALLDLRAAESHFGVPVVPHNFYYGPALLATAQFIALSPAATTATGHRRPELEVPFLGWPQVLHPLHAPHQGSMNAQGVFVLPVDAGLGFHPDLGVLRAHRTRYASLRLEHGAKG